MVRRINCCKKGTKQNCKARSLSSASHHFHHHFLSLVPIYHLFSSPSYPQQSHSFQDLCSKIIWGLLWPPFFLCWNLSIFLSECHITWYTDSNHIFLLLVLLSSLMLSPKLKTTPFPFLLSQKHFKYPLSFLCIHLSSLAAFPHYINILKSPSYLKTLSLKDKY